jgi:RNA polymerase sigma factor (TIGR02999 family)
MSEVTRILQAIEQGDARAAEQLLPLVYDELRKLAAQKLVHEAPGQTLTATALVHEAYLRLVGAGEESRWDSRGHFFATAAEAMRRILIENARRKRSRKHGGGLKRHDAEEALLEAPEPSEDLLALDEALTKLAEKDLQKAELVKLRYFAGMTLEESADLLGISTATAKRWWTYTRAWLYREMTCEAAPPPTEGGQGGDEKDKKAEPIRSRISH